MKDQALLKAIGEWKLAGYFEDLDDIRHGGKVNMFGAAPHLVRLNAGMSIQEARSVLAAWQHTLSNSLPAEDRALKAIEE